MKTGIRHRWSEVRALFEAAIERPRATRTAFVAQSAGDTLLRDAVLALLASEDGATLVPEVADAVADKAPGQRLGNYRIVRVLGRGGMGVVYLAEQQQPQRQVAIKLIAGAHDAPVLARFKREADLLARLAHPGIAQVFDVGADDERPFLAMEYIDGQPLTDYATTLNREQRLELLAHIADAVDHANGRGIVHRDLKPSNILVGSNGQPKVLDFGIAFLSVPGVETLTATGVLLGTPAYMSPEQAIGGSVVDARTDVYALGVIGYELLADRLPLSVAGLTPLQALRVVGEDTPPPLSRLDRRLAGDLETIIGKALAKEPSLRYPNAGAFADDLRRYLAHEPIRARRPSVWRRLRLFTRRNPLLMALAAVAAISLVAGLAFSLSFAWSEARERERAVAASARAEAALAQARGALTALNQVFSAGNPIVAGQPNVSFRDVLASAAEQIANVPDATRANVLYALAEAQFNLGDSDAADQRFAAVQTLARALGDNNLYLRAGVRRARQMADQDSPVLAERYIAELLKDADAQKDPLIHASLLLQHAKAAYFRGHWVSSLTRVQAAQALWPLPENDVDPGLRNELEVELLTLQTPVLLSQGNPAAIKGLLQAMQSALARLTPAMGEEHPRLVRLRVVADALGDLADLRTRIPKLGATHPTVLASIQAGIDMPILDVADLTQFLELAATTVRALPVGSRLRSRIATNISSSNFVGVAAESLEDYLAMASAQCLPDAPLDQDCVALKSAAAKLLQRERRSEEALALLESMAEPAAVSDDPSLVHIVNLALAAGYRDAERADDALRAADAALAALLRDPEVDEALRDRLVFQLSWYYRPAHCDRVLDLLLPRESRLRSQPGAQIDVLSRLLSTCEVHAGRDPAPALARLDVLWNAAERDAAASAVRLELIIGYLEIFDTLGRDDDFARWAEALRELERSGVPLDVVRGRPWVERALKLEP
jgi:predicted Ser/Thr protein kinase